MPITALPPNAVRAIGSSQALSDSASVVKELLDNAIDAQANKISIEISANSLDDIRVRDNGHGIPPDDRAMICTKYCTSKIRNLRDLETIGGRSLGFRGEALASAAEMSGSLTITTRIEGENTAVELKIDRKGQISGEKRTSFPVGTTVKVEKFLQNLPVRRQAAEKIAMKMLGKVKRMLQAYALARPNLRLSLKILKAKDRKGDWTYPKSGAPSASRLEAGLHAATDIFGKKLTSHCDSVFSSWSGNGEQIDEATVEKLGPSASRDEWYTLEATMAKQDCDGTVLSNVGQYISVDSRPMSCQRGALKQIASLYKAHLRSAISNEGNINIVDPFLCLNIFCPSGSYDANVEPAKDDVLFTNSELLLGIVERFFRNIYGEAQSTSSKSPMKSISAPKPPGIEILFARKESPVELNPARIPLVVESSLSSPRPASRTPAHDQPNLRLRKTRAHDLPSVAPSHQNGGEIFEAIGHSTTGHRATAETNADASPSLLPSHDTSVYPSTGQAGFESSGDAVSVGGKTCWKGCMYAEDEDEEADLGDHLQERAESPVDLGLDGDEHLRDAKVSNPWAFAKLNAAIRPSGRNKQLHTPTRQTGDTGQSADPSSDDLLQQVDLPLLRKSLPHGHPFRPSPEAAYPTPSPFPFPLKARGKRKADDVGADASSKAAASTKERPKRGALDTWVQKSLGGYDEPDDSSDTRQDGQGPPDLPYSRDFVTARSLPVGGTPLGEIPDASQRPRRKPMPRRQQQGNINRPFVPPVSDPDRIWFDIGEDPSQKRQRKPRTKHNRQDTAKAPTLNLREDDDEIEDDESTVPTSAERPARPIHPDLAITLDYEARKQKASDMHRKSLREQAAAAKLASKLQNDVPNPLRPQHNNTTSSPHKNRQAKAIAALHNDPPLTSRTTTTTPPLPEAEQEDYPALSPSDPRAHLLRLHQDPAPRAKYPRRHKTALLPFETVTQESYIGDLKMLISDVNVDDVEADMRESGAWDRYVRSGKEEEGGIGSGAFKEEVVGGGEVRRWEGKLRELVREMYAVRGAEREGEGEGDGRRGSVDVDIDLSNILRAHAAQFA